MPNRKPLTREYLEFQANRIEAVLAAHRIPAQVRGGSTSPRWLRFLLAPGPRTRINQVRCLREELALALDSENVRIARDGNTLTVEVARPDPEPVQLRPLLKQLSDVPPLTACLGMTSDGRPLLLRLPSPDVVHVLVAGATGSGKTELIRTLLISLALANRQAQLQIALIDLKQRGLAPLGGLPHLLTEPAYEANAAAELLESLVDEMIRRDDEGRSAPHIVVVVDELPELLHLAGAPAQSALARIAQRGREAGLHLVLGAQKPTAALLGGALKANLPVRLVGRVGNADEARVATGVGKSGAEQLLGRGDFLAVTGGQIIRFQAAYVPVADWVEFDAALRTGQAHRYTSTQVNMGQ